MNDRVIRVLLRLASAGAVIAALVHLAALVSPSFNESTYSATYPWWRHVIFIGINLTLAWLLTEPPSWFVWPYSVLTARCCTAMASADCENGGGQDACTGWTSSL